MSVLHSISYQDEPAQDEPSGLPVEGPDDTPSTGEEASPPPEAPTNA